MTTHDEETITHALTALVLAAGNSRKAAIRLEEATGKKVNFKTLWRWQRTHADRYEKIRNRELPRLQREAADKHHALADEEMRVSALATEKLEAALKEDEIPARDLSTVQRNLDTGAAINRDKAAILRGEPTAVVEHRDVAEIIRSLKAKGVDPKKLGLINAESKEVKS